MQNTPLCMQDTPKSRERTAQISEAREDEGIVVTPARGRSQDVKIGPTDRGSCNPHEADSSGNPFYDDRRTRSPD